MIKWGASMQLEEPHDDASESCEHDLEQLMVRYQKADPDATAVLIERLSPRLYRFFASQLGNRTDADDMLQDLWLRVHRVRHTYRSGQPLLPWVYAIAHRVRIDSYRKRRRTSREIGVDVLPERAVPQEKQSNVPAFDELLATLPEGQREVLPMLKVGGLSLQDAFPGVFSRLWRKSGQESRGPSTTDDALAGSQGRGNDDVSRRGRRDH